MQCTVIGYIQNEYRAMFKMNITLYSKWIQTYIQNGYTKRGCGIPILNTNI